MVTAAQQKVLDRTDSSGDCWLWTRAIHKKTGYGAFAVNYKSVLAHRFAYEVFIGPIPDGMQLDHLCRVRHCVNPTHLEPVSPRENLLRGLTPAAANTAKTHCPSGHVYDEANTIRKNGRRHCRACANAYQRRRNTERRAS